MKTGVTSTTSMKFRVNIDVINYFPPLKLKQSENTVV